MKILSRHAALKLLQGQSARFRPHGWPTPKMSEFHRERIDRGKYSKNGYGTEVPDHIAQHYYVVWSEQRRDSSGPYYVVMGSTGDLIK